jgi:hypothetical protein
VALRLKKKDCVGATFCLTLALALVQHRSDSSVLEDLLAKLHDFPHVPCELSLNAEMLPLNPDRPEDHVSSKHIPVAISPIIDIPEMALEVLPLETEAESDATHACLQASQILRSCVLHPCIFGFGV